jgi:hypothetical protein
VCMCVCVVCGVCVCVCVCVRDVFVYGMCVYGMCVCTVLCACVLEHIPTDATYCRHLLLQEMLQRCVKVDVRNTRHLLYTQCAV